MSASQSNLSSYGADFVVATTQQGMNAALRELLYYHPGPQTALYYVADASGKPQSVPASALGGINPFDIPANATPASNAQLAQLVSLGFVAAFECNAGNPAGIALNALPDYVTLQPGSDGILFTLHCASFQVVALTNGAWLNQSQPSGVSWAFTSSINMKLAPLGSNTPPPAVQQQMNAMAGTAFGVQELLLDLDSAALESTPTIEGVTQDTALYNVLQSDFVGQYFASLQATGGTVLGYAVTPGTVPPSSITLTSLNFQVSPFLDTNGQPVTSPSAEQQGAVTLNYVCAANGDPLPAPANFSWNWMEVSDASQADGVIAISRAAFVRYFRSQLDPIVANGCLVPHVVVTEHDLIPHYSATLAPGGTPTIVAPPTGTTVLQYNYPGASRDQAGLDGDLGKMSIETLYNVTVSLSGTSIVITQSIVVDIYIKHLATSASGSVVNKTITDTYAITVGESGNLLTVCTPVIVDTGKPPKANAFTNFFANVDDKMKEFASYSNNYVSTNFGNVPVSVAQNFLFPGGQNFVFSNPTFSSSQDLVAYITYVNPS